MRNEVHPCEMKTHDMEGDSSNASFLNSLIGPKHVSIFSALGAALVCVPRQTLAVVCFEPSFSWPRTVYLKVMCNPIVWRAEERPTLRVKACVGSVFSGRSGWAEELLTRLCSQSRARRISRQTPALVYFKFPFSGSEDCVFDKPRNPIVVECRMTSLAIDIG